MAKIVKVRKANGSIVAVKLDNNKELSITDAVESAKNGGIEGVIVGTDRSGDEYLHSKRGQLDYKLDDLPKF